MQRNINKIAKSFSDRKVSVNHVVRSLRRNGIRVNEDQAVTILDFLYLLASSFKKVNQVDEEMNARVKETSNTL